MATKKRSLGTGLDSLFGADTVTVEKEPTATLPLTKLEPRQEQPRNYFDEELPVGRSDPERETNNPEF